MPRAMIGSCDIHCPPGSIVQVVLPTPIVSGLPMSGDHPMHPFVINAEGLMYVDVASATNSCS